MPDAIIDGRVLHYERAGEGAPVLLLHGFPFTSRSWRPQLERPPQGCQLIAVDHRGFGGSTLVPGVSTMESMADDALKLLDTLGIASAFVAGLSMGGYVAIALTRLDPGRVRGLALVDTQSLADDDAGRARREQTALEVEAKGLSVLVESMLPRLLAPQASPALRTEVEAMMRSVSPAAAAAASRGMASRVDGKDILSRYSGRCVVVVGELDVITPPEKARVMVDLVQGARLEVIAGAGHLTNLEQPEAFNAVLERFVGG